MVGFSWYFAFMAKACPVNDRVRTDVHSERLSLENNDMCCA